MFTNKTEGNTLYIIRKQKDLMYQPFWPRLFVGFITISLLVFYKWQALVYSVLAFGIPAVASYFIEEWYLKNHRLVKVTKLPQPYTVAFNNKIIVNPRFVFNRAGYGLGSRYGYTIYLQKYDGDVTKVVDYIYSKTEMYTIMELIAGHLDIGIRKDN